MEADEECRYHRGTLKPLLDEGVVVDRWRARAAWASHLRHQMLRLVLVLLAAGACLLEDGFRREVLPLWVLRPAALLLLGAYVVDLVYRRRQHRGPLHMRRSWWVAYGPPAAGFGAAVAYVIWRDLWMWQAAQAAIFALSLIELWRLNVSLSWKLATPGSILPMSFVLLILVGTVLLKLPIAVPEDQHISWLDALFTMTSAVCVTGLTVRSTLMDFTPFGQAVIGLFIQLGGLGIIIFGSMFALLLGGGLSLREIRNLSSMLNDQPLHQIRMLVWFIVLSTLGIELAGAAMMYPLWQGDLSTQERLGMSLFHSVSAYCNAGFDITGNSLVPYRYTLNTHVLHAGLILLGGLGFPVLYNLTAVAWRHLRGRIRGVMVSPMQRRLSLHTKLVLVTTLALYLYGAVFLGLGQAVKQWFPQQAGEAPVTVGPLYHPASLLRLAADSHFMSITARTAGFNSMPMDEISLAGRFVLITLMFVGGSSGGTAGGVKTTTLSVLLLSVMATILARRETEVFRRQIADAVVRRAAAVVASMLMVIAVATLLLCLTEPFEFMDMLFEVVSATTTTGLSLGITADLSVMGKLVIIAAMFLGRVGPLSLLGALMLRSSAERRYSYPHEEVVLG